MEFNIEDEKVEKTGNVFELEGDTQETTPQEPQSSHTETFMVYTVNGKETTLRFSMNRIGMIEEVLGKSVISAIQGVGGMPRINDLKTVFGYGLKYSDGGWLSPTQGVKVAEQMIENEKNGLTRMIQDCMVAIQRDCPFFFPGD